MSRQPGQWSSTCRLSKIFHLFNVRYLHMRSLAWRGALGTPVGLGTIAVVITGLGLPLFVVLGRKKLPPRKLG